MHERKENSRSVLCKRRKLTMFCLQPEAARCFLSFCLSVWSRPIRNGMYTCLFFRAAEANATPSHASALVTRLCFQQAVGQDFPPPPRTWTHTLPFSLTWSRACRHNTLTGYDTGVTGLILISANDNSVQTDHKFKCRSAHLSSRSSSLFILETEKVILWANSCVLHPAASGSHVKWEYK